MYRQGWRVIIALVLLGMLSACGGPAPPPPPAVVQLSVVAALDINPDASRRPTPVLVRVFQLISPNKFERADFFQMADNEQAALGSDALGKYGIIISPGQTRHLTINMKHDATVLGVAASFRDIDKARWRGDIAVPSTGTVAVTVAIHGLTLNVTKSGP